MATIALSIVRGVHAPALAIGHRLISIRLIADMSVATATAEVRVRLAIQVTVTGVEVVADTPAASAAISPTPAASAVAPSGPGARDAALVQSVLDDPA